MKCSCVIFLLLYSTLTTAGQFVVDGPDRPVAAVAGEEVLLPCFLRPSVSAVDKEVMWLIGSAVVHHYRRHRDEADLQLQDYRGRTSLSREELQRGNVSLRLTSVHLSDANTYRCYIVTSEGHLETNIELTVEAVGSTPNISAESLRNGSVRLRCGSDGWSPEPRLEWLDSRGQILAAEPTEVQRRPEGFSVTRSITVQEVDGSSFSCRVSHSKQTKVQEHDVPRNLFAQPRHYWFLNLPLVSGLVVVVFFAVFYQAVPPPENLSVKLGPSSVSVTWTKPAGLDQVSYQLELFRDQEYIKNIRSDSPHYNLTDLQHGAEYTIKVATVRKRLPHHCHRCFYKSRAVSKTFVSSAPVCLIDNGADGRMSVQQEALQILEQITQPVVVVAVVGQYCTGKSYLMNRLAGAQTGFALGRTIEPTTKGIWMWCVPHPSEPEHTLVLLDTEGLGSVEKGDEEHDTWIFCLAVMLSSTLVYNSRATIDTSALEKLSSVTEHIKKRSNGHEKINFPSFIWAVRDFTTDLKLEGRPITADEYLENSLKNIPGSSDEIKRHNQVRQGLRDLFAVRRCFVFERPANVRQMKRMEELTDEELDADFLKNAEAFCSYVLSMRGGLGVTGRMLGSLAEKYVQMICSGQVPSLESAAESVAGADPGRRHYTT